MDANELRAYLARHVDLPTLAPRVAELQAMLGDADASSSEAAALVADDPAISVQVVRIASSPMFGSGPPVETVEQGVVRVGLLELGRIVTSVAAIDAMAGLCDRRFTARVWSHAMTTGIAAGMLAHLCDEVPEVRRERNPYYLSGILHEVGALLIEPVVGPARWGVYLERVRAGEPVHDVERDLLGFDHAEVGAALLESWGLVPNVVEAVRFHHDPSKAPAEYRLEASVLHVADWLANRQGFGWGENGEALCDEGWIRLGLDLGDFDEIVSAFETAAQESEALLATADG